MSKKKKTYTVCGHRQMQAIKEKAKISYYDGYQAGRVAIISSINTLIPISQQVIDTVDAGMDVEIHCKISAKELLKIYREEK